MAAPQGAPADVVKPPPNGVLQLLVTQQDCCSQGQQEVLSGIVDILTPWCGGQRRDSISNTS
jgi:hypothetical protein